MFKKIFCVIITLIIVSGVFLTAFGEKILYPSYEMTKSIEAAQSLGLGWNLGNTLEACEKHSKEKAGLETETMWGNPETTKELFSFVKECGFQSVRLPVTWAQHLSDAPDYKIDEKWLDRVSDVVDMALLLDMKVIINVHHDDAFWLITDNEHKENSEEILCKIWKQIAERFRDYDNNLFFETMNEPRVEGAEDEWQGNEETREVVNYLNFAALKTIRNSGGNNKERFVLLPTYAASGLIENLEAMKVPDDDRVMVSVHYYYGTAHQSEFLDCDRKWNFGDRKNMYKTFRKMFDLFISNGIGVVEGEFGWTDRDNLQNLSYNAKYYVDLAGRFGIPCLVWDNGSHFGLIDRNKLEEIYPDYIDAVTPAQL